MASAAVNLVQNPGFETISPDTKIPSPANYTLQGSAVWQIAGREDEITSWGIAFPGDSKDGGGVSQMVTGLDQSKGRWLTFTFRGLAEDGFAVAEDALAMKIEFYSKNGTHYLEDATRLIYREIENDRRTLAANGNRGKAGAAAWRTYGFEELIPFPEVDAVKISVTYKNGASSLARASSFFLDDFSLTQSTASPTGRIDPATRVSTAPPRPVVDETKLIPLGGRWYYDLAPGESAVWVSDGKQIGPLTVTEENADRLYYKAGSWITPFAHNMTAWLRPGHLDAQGILVKKDRFLPDNVTLFFKGDGYLTMRAKNIPNHPTARFPDTYGTQGYNPSHIQELNKIYRLPLAPIPNPQAFAMDPKNLNYALPGGAIGVAVNGVVFYNPFDAGAMDASSLMDRCCGHPSPDNRYHYHKYPICVNTPFADKGDAHSGLLGFAFDGLPVYGPYEEAGVMAMDSKTNPLNAFNAHQDPQRGWHYHVTPGKFPYLIGGFLAKSEPSNFEIRPMQPPGRLGPWPPPPPPPAYPR